jgi:hypothetical protein
MVPVDPLSFDFADPRLTFLRELIKFQIFEK